jgi:hypothetical protein
MNTKKATVKTKGNSGTKTTVAGNPTPPKRKTSKAKALGSGK